MWNDARGFGFITPDDGGEDVFVHRSALGEGVVLSPGQPVTFEPQWDDAKRKSRAASVTLAEGGPSPGGGGTPAPGGGAGAPARTGPPSWSGGGGISIRPRAHHIVGAYADWQIRREPMAPGQDGSPRHRLVVRSDAPPAPEDKRLRREEFQIVGDADWEKRFYPAGPDREEVVVIRPGGPASTMAHGRGKGHGRNWAVEGRPGAAFDIVVNTVAHTVTCEAAFTESQ